jgi:DNA-binding response OmpR family regulator
MNTNPYILIVDDNPENIKVLGTILSKKNYRLMVAQNGVQALKAVSVIMPDLILLDIMMPEMDGYQLCEELKKQERTRDIPIIFLTAASDQEHELKGLKLGAVDYIHKPFSIPIVEARVSTHLEVIQSRKALQEKNAALEEMAKLRDEIDKITQHDLKVPLNAIIGFPQLLLMDSNLTEEQRELLNHVVRAGYEMLGMINMSLDLFKMETGRYQYEPQNFDMTLLLQAVIKDLQPLAHSHAVEVVVFIEDKIFTDQEFIVEAEKILCHSLFANLLKNAIEASPREATVKFTLQHRVEEDLIAVTNVGTVPESIREHFFDKYVTAGKKQGSGIGTYSAKLMTQVQHGRIKMTTNAKETTVTVYLPAKHRFEI